MTDPRRVKHAILQVEAALQRFVPQLSQSLRDAQLEIRQTQEKLSRRQSELERELQNARRALEQAKVALVQAKEALAACRSTPPDEKGRRPDCSQYAQAVRNAEQAIREREREIREIENKLKKLRQLQQLLRTSVAQFEKRATSAINTATKSAQKGQYFLRERQKALERFEHVGSWGGGSTPVVFGAAATAFALKAVWKTASSLWNSATASGHLNLLQGDWAEKRGVAAARALGAQRAGLGLHTGRQGVDAYGLRNTPKGRTLLALEVKSTRDPKARGTTSEILRRLRVDKRGLQQGSRLYTISRIRNAARSGNRVARHVLGAQAHTGSNRIRRVQNYVHWVNVATGEEKTFRAFSNQRGNRVVRLQLVRYLPPRSYRSVQ